ncbi:MAG: tetratricopeptide repeat protein, partial [Gemmatimonadota bacterium]
MTAFVVLALAAGLQQQVQDTTIYARAESLLVAGELADARRILERKVRRDREDVRALTLLGRVHLAWPVIGRWKAWDYLESARKAEPGDPEPPYWQVQVGLHLAMEDGQWMIKRGLFDVWRADPHYKDTWDIADQVYWSNEDRREAAAILASHSDDPFAALQGARLLVDAGEYERAAAVLDSLVAAGHESGTLWALRAQCALESGDVNGGTAY